MIRRIVNSKRMPFGVYWRLFNFWPAIRGTGGRVTHVSRDWTAIDIKLRLSYRTTNYVGTIYGGSMYSAVDPWFMVMALRQLGDDYVVWDKSARVGFKRPGTETLYASFRLPHEETARIKQQVDAENRIDKAFSVDLKDADGKVYATVDKVLFIARKDWFQARQQRRAERAS